MINKLYMSGLIIDLPRIPENEFLFKSILDEEQEEDKILSEEKCLRRKKRKKRRDLCLSIPQCLTEGRSADLGHWVQVTFPYGNKKTQDFIPESFRFVRKMGLEPTRLYRHKILSLACLPIPALPHKI